MKNGVFGAACRSLETALPDRQDAPAGPAQSFGGALIPLLIAGDLGGPEFRARSGKLEKRTMMAVPETAMHEDGRPISRKHQVRAARQVAGMQPEAQAGCVKTAAKDQFRLRVAAADADHIELSLRDRQDINHRTSAARDTILQRGAGVHSVVIRAIISRKSSECCGRKRTSDSARACRLRSWLVGAARRQDRAKGRQRGINITR